MKLVSFNTFHMLSCREASNSILTFLSDIFDLAKTSPGEQYQSIRDTVIIPRGASITRILIACLTGALPSSRLETVRPSCLYLILYPSHVSMTLVLTYMGKLLLKLGLLVPQVTYALLALTRAYGMKAVEWAKDCISLVPLTAVTEVERTRFLQTLSNVATGADLNTLTVSMEELSDVCRRNRTVQEIVQGALRPHELNLAPVS